MLNLWLGAPTFPNCVIIPDRTLWVLWLPPHIYYTKLSPSKTRMHNLETFGYESAWLKTDRWVTIWTLPKTWETVVSIIGKLLQKSRGRLRGRKALEYAKGLEEALCLGWNWVQRRKARWLLPARGLISPLPDPTQLVACRRHRLATLPSLS